MAGFSRSIGVIDFNNSLRSFRRRGLQTGIDGPTKLINRNAILANHAGTKLPSQIHYPKRLVLVAGQ